MRCDYTIVCTGNKHNDAQIIKNALKTTSSDNIQIAILKFSNKNTVDNYVKCLCDDAGGLYYRIFHVPYLCQLIHGLDAVDILTDDCYLYRIPNLFLTIITLAVAFAEASGSRYLWVGIDNNGLEYISPKKEAYLEKLKNLINSGTFIESSIELNAIIFDNLPAIYNHDEVILTNDCEAMVLFSGGIDCIATSYIMHSLKKHLHLFNMQYESTNRFQEEYCIHNFIQKTKNLGNFTFKQLPLNTLKEIGGSVCLDDSQTLHEENRKLEYIPFRNTIFIAMGILYNLANKITYIVTGSHHDDQLCPDNKLDYYNIYQEILSLQYSTQNIIIYPVGLYIGGKKELLYIASKMGANIRYSWSCNSFTPREEVGDDAKQCGRCTNCISRYSAFSDLNIVDPFGYHFVPMINANRSGWDKNAELILKQIGINNLNYM